MPIRSTTSRRRTKKETKTTAERYQKLVEGSLGLICIHDLDGALLYVNPAAAQTLGYTRDEWVGRNLVEFLALDVHPLFADYLNRIRKHPTDTGLLRLVTKGGEERIWSYHNIRYDEAGQPSYVIGHALDLTEFVQTRRALHASEARFRALIENSSEMIVVLDADGAVRYESPSTVRVLGYSLGECVGKSGFTFVHPEDLPLVT